jgi:hypothetical protein
MAHPRKKKNAPRQRTFGKYTFTSIGLQWWKCGDLELWAWSGKLDGLTWTRTWVFQYKGVIVEELISDEWEKPFSTLGKKLADGGFDKSMEQIDKGKDDFAVCGFMEIKEQPNSSFGQTHYFYEDTYITGVGKNKRKRRRTTIVKIKR